MRMKTAQALGLREEIIMSGTKHDCETKESRRHRLERALDPNARRAPFFRLRHSRI